MKYDLLDRHIRTNIDASAVASPNALSSLSATFALFRYDAAGNLIYHENDYCIAEINRNSLGLPILEKVNIQNIMGAPASQQITRGFDLAGRRIKIIYPSMREVSYGRDLRGRVTSVRNVTAPPVYPGQGANAAGFDLARYTYIGDRLTRVDFGNLLNFVMRFDGRGHLLERVVAKSDGTTLWRSQRLRDAAGHTRIENATARAGARSRKLSLDSIYRLTHYEDSGISWFNAATVAPPHVPANPLTASSQGLIDSQIPPLATPSTPSVFEYDEMGNRTRTREPGLTTFSSTPNQLNQYGDVNGTVWRYDQNGNLRLDGTWAFAYDMNNSMNEILDSASGSRLVNYYRDAVGRVIAEATPGRTAFRIYDGTLPLMEISGTGRKEFTPGHQSDVALHVAVGGRDYWATYDGLISLRLITDDSGNVISIPAYRPFGASEDGELALSPFHFGFAGMWHTPSIPFYHSRRRSYRANLGRHLQRDPAGFIDDLNLYSYVRNSPTDYNDPTGLVGLAWEGPPPSPISETASAANGEYTLGSYSLQLNFDPVEFEETIGISSDVIQQAAAEMASRTLGVNPFGVLLDVGERAMDLADEGATLYGVYSLTSSIGLLRQNVLRLGEWTQAYSYTRAWGGNLVGNYLRLSLDPIFTRYNILRASLPTTFAGSGAYVWHVTRPAAWRFGLSIASRFGAGTLTVAPYVAGAAVVGTAVVGGTSTLTGHYYAATRRIWVGAPPLAGPPPLH